MSTVLLVTLVASGTIVVKGTSDALVDQIDEQLRSYTTRSQGVAPPPINDLPPQNANEIEFFGRPVARLLLDKNGRIQHSSPSGFPDHPDPLPEFTADTLDQLHKKSTGIVTVPSMDGSIRFRALIQQEPNGDIMVTAIPLTEIDATLSRLERNLLIIGALALVAATLASSWLIRRGLKPVDQMVETATAIAQGDFSQRVPDTHPRTELGRLGHALNKMLHHIESALQARTESESRLRQFVADAAHELRTPLTSLRGYAELYRKGGLPDEPSVTMAMERIQMEGSRMARLLDDMLLLARLDQQRGLEMVPVDLGALVAEAVADFRVVSPEHPATIALQDGIIVRGDQFRLRQIVDNLLTNIRVHTPAGTPITISMGIDDDMASLVIADEGPGIGAAEQKHIFDRFWRGGPARLRSGSGTGLGLAIVASLIKAHGGTIHVMSEPESGTSFLIHLPLMKSA